MTVSRRLQDMVEAGADDDVAAIRPAPSCIAASAIAPIGTAPSAAFICPHLRNAVYNHLIAADNLSGSVAGTGSSLAIESRETCAANLRPWVEAAGDDFNFDGRQEVQLAGDKLDRLRRPSRGGADLRARRPLDLPQPAGHAQPPARGVSSPGAGRPNWRRRQRNRRHSVRSSSSRPASKTSCSTTRTLRKSLLDHLYDDECRLRPWLSGEAMERGDFLGLGPTKPAPPQSRPHPGQLVRGKATPGACRSRSPRA